MGACPTNHLLRVGNQLLSLKLCSRQHTAVGEIGSSQRWKPRDVLREIVFEPDRNAYVCNFLMLVVLDRRPRTSWPTTGLTSHEVC